jgi:hypothetical protein
VTVCGMATRLVRMNNIEGVVEPFISAHCLSKLTKVRTSATLSPAPIRRDPTRRGRPSVVAALARVGAFVYPLRPSPNMRYLLGSGALQEIFGFTPV